MKPTMGIQLAILKANGELDGLISRGGTAELYGVKCNYVGVTPDGMAWFWVGPGDIRPLDGEQLATQGMKLWDSLDGKKKGV